MLVKIFNVADENDKCRLVEALARYVNSVNVNKYKTKWLTFLEENKTYLKGSQKPMRYSPGNAFYPTDNKGTQQVTVNQFPDTTGGGTSFRGTTGSFAGSQMQGFTQQPNYPGYNQYMGQGYSQGGYNPSQSQGGYNPNQNQGFNQGYKQSFTGGSYYQPQQQANVIPTSSTKKQPSMGGMGTTGGMPSYPEYQSGGMYSGFPQGGYGGFDNTGSNPWSSGTGGFPQNPFPQTTTTQQRKPNFNPNPNYFEGQKKF